LFHIEAPLAFVGLMTFILIASSVTMVLAVEAGHRMDRKNVEKYMIWTILGGFAFLSCQAYEWYHFILGTEGGSVYLMDVSKSVATVMHDGGLVVQNGIHHGANLLDPANAALADSVVGGIQPESFRQGASLIHNQYAQNPSFANLFFFITGFHGTHVASGVFLNYLVYKQVRNGVMDERGHYEMIEKVGLYWHFVDLVWVFVFTFFYLI
jgi:cytochrome c oxidase subunit 3